MATAAWGNCDFYPDFTEMLGGLSEFIDQARRGAWAMASERGQGGPGRSGRPGRSDGSGRGDGPGRSGRPDGPPGPGFRGEPRGRGHHKGAGHWGGGFGGQWGTWWPGPPGPPGAGGPPRSRKASRGDVRAAILALLREGPRTGYQIMSDIDERSGGAWRPSPGAVYPALSALADEGLITGAESAGKRIFSLTEAGQRYVDENPEMARGAWESTAQQEAWQIPGLFAEAARLGGGIMQVAQAGSPDQVRAAERLLQRTRRELYQILADSDDEDEDDDEDAGEAGPEQEA